MITLEHAQERRDIIAARLGELQIPFEFYPEVDGRKVDLLSHPNYSKWKRRMFFGRDLSKGEFGCVLAHQSIYEHISGRPFIPLVLPIGRYWSIAPYATGTDRHASPAGHPDSAR